MKSIRFSGDINAAFQLALFAFLVSNPGWAYRNHPRLVSPACRTPYTLHSTHHRHSAVAHLPYILLKIKLMKKPLFNTFTWAICAFLSTFAPTCFAQTTDLKTAFLHPSAEARPQVWWHWMNGNITREGIRKDLTWMHDIGLGGVHIFDAGFSVPRIVRWVPRQEPP